MVIVLCLLTEIFILLSLHELISVALGHGQISAKLFSMNVLTFFVFKSQMICFHI